MNRYMTLAGGTTIEATDSPDMPGAIRFIVWSRDLEIIEMCESEDNRVGFHIACSAARALENGRRLPLW